ncbi:wax ester synthase/diacylglycerol acyltransferase 11-like isoform X1 [Magnolia sinica]|uniref:wax ester synthase/diacylglycerol acyltransferase 11-like isoform X1 n=1 Tax=Magnolia sinica TaxID=86752 RepID=UPI00265B4AE4|nr:wax ester synthase/diacylglycerol acyltransferase 11-like isoform X1 [Magnolia sinica]
MDSRDGFRSRKTSLNRLLTTESLIKEGKGMANGKLTEEDEQPLSPAARLFHQPHFNCHIIAIIGCGKRFDVDVVKAGLEATLLRHPRFSSIHVIDEKKGEQKWVRTEVVLENHLVMPDLDPHMESPDQFVEDYVSDLTRTTLETTKPLWEIHLLNVKTAEADSTAVLRIHHSLGDGASLMSLVLACTRKTADPAAPPTIPDKRVAGWKRSRSLPVLAMLWAVFRMVWHTIVDVLLFLATAACLTDTRTPLKGTKGVEHQPKRVVHRNLSLDDMKAVKNATKSTINDVLLGVTAAGLSRYLCRLSGKDKATEDGKHNLPANARLRAAVLVNIRPAPRIQALSEMMETDGPAVEWGNRLGYVLIPFSVQVPEDPLDYIRRAKATADRKKLSFESIFTYWSGFLLVKLFGIKAAAALCYRMLSNTTLSFSNIMGPGEEISFYGHPIAYIAPTVYGHPHALTIHFQSYMNKVKMVIAVDENAIPDPHQLCDDLTDSLILIKNAVETRQ